MLYGHQNDQGHWYLFNNVSGAMQYGWNSFGGKMYHYNTSSGIQDRVYNPVYYSQRDGRWVNTWFNGVTFGDTGCAMTVLAMIASGYGINLNPVQAGYTGQKVGTFNNPTYGSDQRTILSTAHHYGLKTQVLYSTASIVDKLKAGYSVALAVDVPGGSHEITLSGYSNGYTSVLDPWNHYFFNGWYSVNGLWGIRSSNSMDYQLGSPATLIYM